MGTHSYSDECPKCGESMCCWNDTRSFHSGGECLECGYSFYTKEGKLTIEEVNERREEQELKPIKKLKRSTIIE